MVYLRYGFDAWLRNLEGAGRQNVQISRGGVVVRDQPASA